MVSSQCCYGDRVGSQWVTKCSSSASSDFMSAALSGASPSCAFSSMRAGVTDLGITTQPRWRHQRIITCAGVKLHRRATCAQINQ